MGSSKGTREGGVAGSKRVALRKLIEQAGRFADEFYAAPYRASIARARRDEEDLFVLLVFSEAMGLPNPASYYTLELQPLLLERFHEWHRRMGIERSPLDHFRCC
jgi:hypothetical protein